MPLMSVIVPAYNREAVVEKCLRAIRESTFKDYELIVVDGASTDQTRSMAKAYADKVVELADNPERSRVRAAGAAVSQGEIIVNIDSDVVIKPDALAVMADYLSGHPNIEAVTACLAKEQPDSNFFTQYKNLYMHYVFKRLPEKVFFLYGSLFAVRARSWPVGRAVIRTPVKIADDTDLGQQLISDKKEIVLLKNLEVTHLKKYNFFSFVKNDFLIPFDWAKIFLKYRGWRQVGQNRNGFAHASLSQLASVMLAPIISILILAGVFSGGLYFGPALFLAFVWFLLNFPFIKFLTGEKGFLFGIRSVPVTFMDQLIMALGIAAGLVAAGLSKKS